MLTLLTVTACLAMPVAADQQQDPIKPATVPTSSKKAASSKKNDEAWFDRDLADQCAAAADKGLLWLKQRQLSTGAWTGLVGHKQGSSYMVLDASILPEGQRKRGEGHIGVTAICGMAFLAGGNLPDRGQYKNVVRLAEDFVVTHSQKSGLLSSAGTRMYSHAFATLFLAEVYGMAANERTKVTLERAVNLIVDSQNPYGGWRYNAFDRNIDLSVTVCQLQALRASRNIGIRVSTGTIDKAMNYVRRSRVSRGYEQGLFYYKIHGRGSYNKPRQFAINAAAMTALSSAGIHDDDLSDPVLTFLENEYATLAHRDGSHFYYWYGNYYAAQAFYQFGGTRLRAFYARMAKDLLAAQAADGRWRNSVGPGDEFGTAVACILLQMPRQYLPIFQR